MKKFLWTIIILIVLGIGLWFVSKKTSRLNFITITTSIGGQTTLANPASVNCEQKGGALEIVTDANGGQSGLCHLPDGTTCEEWTYYRGECPVVVAETTGIIQSRISKLVLNEKEGIVIFDIDSNTSEPINSTQKLLIPNGIDSTPIKYLYFIDDRGIGFFNIIENKETIYGLPLPNTCKQNIYCNKIIRSFSDINLFLIVGGNEDEGGAFNIISGYIFNIASNTKQYLSKEVISAIGGRGCDLAYNGDTQTIYNLGCDGDETRLSININNNTINNMNFLHQNDYYKAGGFFFGHDRSRNNKVINLEIFDLFENKIQKTSISNELPLAYAYYFDNKNNILVQLLVQGGASCIYLNSNSPIKPLNIDIFNFSSVIDTENSILYVNSKDGIQVVDIKNCSVKKTLNKTAYRIEGFIKQ